MKKIYSCIILTFLAVSISQAQLHIGPKLGVNFSGFSGDSVADYLRITCFQIGVVFDYSFNENLSLQTGVVFMQQGAKTSFEGEEYEKIVVVGDGDKFCINYLQIPVHFQYRAGMFYLHAGPYLGVAIRGKVKHRQGINVGTLGFGITKKVETFKFGGNDGVFKRMDAGLGLGAGFAFNRCRLGFSYNLGLTNISNHDIAIKSDAISLTLTLLFGLTEEQTRTRYKQNHYWN